MFLSNIFKNYINAWKRVVDFKGTSKRIEFWYFLLVDLLLLSLLASIGGAAKGLIVLSILPIPAITVRRLRDAGISLFWLFIILIPLFGPFILFYQLAKISKYKNKTASQNVYENDKSIVSNSGSSFQENITRFKNLLLRIWELTPFSLTNNVPEVIVSEMDYSNLGNDTTNKLEIIDNLIDKGYKIKPIKLFKLDVSYALYDSNGKQIKLWGLGKPFIKANCQGDRLPGISYVAFFLAPFIATRYRDLGFFFICSLSLFTYTFIVLGTPIDPSPIHIIILLSITLLNYSTRFQFKAWHLAKTNIKPMPYIKSIPLSLICFYVAIIPTILLLAFAKA